MIISKSLVPASWNKMSNASSTLDSRISHDSVLALRLGVRHLDVIVTAEAILASLLVNLVVLHAGKLLSSSHVAHLLSVALGEDQVNLLERATRSLGVVEVDDGEEAGVHGSEESVSAPAVGASAMNHDGGDHDDEEVPEPVGDGGGGVSLRAGLERVDLSGVEPREGQPSGTEEGDVSEEADGSTLGSRGSTGNESAEGEDHGQALADSSNEEKLAATDALNSEPRGCSEDGVNDHVDTAKEKSRVVIGTDGLLEENGEVVDDSIATGELLHHLRRGTENETSEVLGLAASEESREGSLSALVASSSDGLLNGGHLSGDIVGVTRLAVETC